MAGSELGGGSFGGGSCREFSSLGTAEGCLEEPAAEASPVSVSVSALFPAALFNNQRRNIRLKNVIITT